MSQEKLGDALGLTFQQIQKYERGANRIGASRLYKIAKILNVPVSYFYEELPEDVESANRGLSDIAPEPFEVDQLNKRETLELVRAYYRVRDARVRKRIFELIKAIAKSDQESA
ncbi:MAG: XRE family transcriptional regulator [Alphaproteobacteria bacterium]|nr:MAG: XRE family transcriptional regulator [Alphaproteobacteria bacterium]